MSVKYGLLGILARQPQHGYELKRSFEQITGGFWQLNYGQIYQTLDRLEGDGYVTFRIEQDESSPDRKVYEITAAGKQALREWLDHPEPRPRPLRDELFIRLAVMPAEDIPGVLDLLEAHRKIYLEKMAQLTRARKRLQRTGTQGEAGAQDALIESLLVDAALFHAEADLRWLDHCESRLKARRRKHAN